jgi:NAD+ kinase
LVKVGIVVRQDSELARARAKELCGWLRGRVQEIRAVPELAAELGAAPFGEVDLFDGLDLIVALGGDGTLLHAVSRNPDPRVPILGINVGALGFLTEVKQEEMLAVMADVLAGKIQPQERMMLQAAIVNADGGRRMLALNEFSISKDALSRMIELEARVDGIYVTKFRADGLVMATPTGSTAYCMAAGGPIVHQDMRCIILIPLCAHTLTTRPLVVPDRSRVQVTLVTRDSHVHLTADGREGVRLESGDTVTITPAAQNLRLFGSPSMNYYEILRTKLGWGEY